VGEGVQHLGPLKVSAIGFENPTKGFQCLNNPGRKGGGDVSGKLRGDPDKLNYRLRLPEDGRIHIYRRSKDRGMSPLAKKPIKNAES